MNGVYLVKIRIGARSVRTEVVGRWAKRGDVRTLVDASRTARKKIERAARGIRS